MVTATGAPRVRRYRLDSGAGLTPAQRAERGKAARAAVPRGSHAVFDPPAGRPDPIALLEEQATSRVPELVPVRYGRMMISPFAYYRGAALPMASDLAATPVSGLAVQACGDAHLSNFGLFGTAERRLVFDVNDFDETLPGPWEWDVKRLAASLEVAARGNGFGGKERRQIVTAMVARYRMAMRRFAAMTNLQVWYTRADVERLPEVQSQMKARQRRTLDQDVAKAHARDSTRELVKLTHITAGRPRIIADPPLLVPIADLVSAGLAGAGPAGAGPAGAGPAGADPVSAGPAGGESELAGLRARLDGLLAQYRRTLEPGRRFLLEQFEVADVARKVVGVGSIGTRCWIALLCGRDTADPLFLQVKEAQASVLSRFCGASTYANQGQRVVAGQRLMQAAGDIFLGWHRIDAGLDGQPRDFYVRQFRDWKFSLSIETMVPRGMRLYGELCGWTLARAHARSGDRIAIAAYLGSSDVFDQAITAFAAAYADQNERDYQGLCQAAASGRITAQHGA